jgi:hypothetical protein
MNDKRQKDILETLFSNADRILFGLASVELKIHEGRLVAVTFSTTENIRQKATEVNSNGNPNEIIHATPM